MGDVTIATPRGGMPGYLSSPGGEGPWPGVVVLHDGFGIGQAVREQADWLAGAGYIAVSVDLCFWGRPPAPRRRSRTPDTTRRPRGTPAGGSSPSSTRTCRRDAEVTRPREPPA